MSTQPAVESPCTGVCTLDGEGVCEGCGRLMAEIVRWPAASVAEQRGIRERAARRLFRPPAGGDADLSPSREPTTP